MSADVSDRALCPVCKRWVAVVVWDAGLWVRSHRYRGLVCPGSGQAMGMKVV